MKIPEETRRVVLQLYGGQPSLRQAAIAAQLRLDERVVAAVLDGKQEPYVRF